MKRFFILIAFFLILKTSIAQSFQLNNVQLWLRSDSVELNNDSLVSRWYDLSSNNYEILQTAIDSMPKLEEDAINGKPAIAFDGLNDYFDGGDILDYNTQSHTVFLIGNSLNTTLCSFWSKAKYGAANSRYGLLYNGNSKEYQYFYLDNSDRTTFVKDNNIAIGEYVFLKVENNRDSALNILSINNNVSDSAIINGNYNFNSDFNFLIGAYNNNTGGVPPASNLFLNGEIVELIIFDTILNQEQTNLVHQYLRDRYSTPVNLGYDINVPYGFCDTTITTAEKPWFKKYLWSTGDTTPTISVNQPGHYSVTTTDVFGFTSTDSVKVNFPSPSSLKDATICMGDSILYSVDMENYQYLWSDGSSNNQTWLKNEDTYSVTLTDSNNCSATFSFELAVDSFASHVSFINDSISLCSGNTIALDNGMEECVSYLWNPGGDTLPYTNVYNTGWNVLNVQNALACKARDSIYVTIEGTAPTPEYTAAGLCFGETTVFTSTSTSPENITETKWIINQNDTIEGLEIEWLFQNNGSQDVSLIVTSESGCSNQLDFQIEIKPVANISFNYTPVCQGIEMEFVSEQSIPEGTNITQNQWVLNQTTISNETNLAYTFDNTGDYQLIYLVTLDNGCSSEFSETITVDDSYPLTENINLVSPLNNQILSQENTLIEFAWNPDESAVKYKLQISDEVSFSNILLEQETTNNLSIQEINSDNDTLFWRVVGYNPCLVEKHSETFALIKFNHGILPNTQLWLRADSIELSNDNLVSRWYDLSSNNYEILQTAVDSTPTLKENAINGNPSILFDGIDDYLNGGDILDYNTQNHTVFLIGNSLNTSLCSFWSKAKYGSANSRRALLYNGNSKEYQFFYHDNSDRTTFVKDTNIATGEYVFLKVENNRASSLNILSLNNNKSDSTIINGDYNFESDFNFLIGAYNNSQGTVPPQPNLFLNGEIAELIIFDTILNQEQTNLVYQYLRDRYSTPVNLGYDINIPYGFCDTTITTAKKPWFKKYQWSTGDTTATISVNQSGYYSVTTTDVFGFTSTDSVKINFPGNLKFEDKTICYGDTLVWDTRLNNNYNFVWQNGTSYVSQSISSEGAYFVTVIDTNGCQFKSDTAHIIVDMYHETDLLEGNDTLCSGTNLYVQDFGGETPLYQWSTGDNDDHITITNSGTYSITATNSLGCEAKDTIEIYVNGYAPTPDFSTNNNCFPGQTEFTDNSSVAGQENINEWYWNFNNNLTSQEQNPTISFSDTGNYTITLKVVTDDACENTVQKNIRIYSTPKASFTTNTALCEGSPIHFINESSSIMGNIENITWMFDDNTSSSEFSTQKMFSEAGEQNIKLIVESLYGCRDTLDSLIQIKPAPVADFSHTEACVGSEILFNDETNTEDIFGISSWQWVASDGNTSNEQNPKFTFTFSGEKQVSMTIRAINGCLDSIQKNIFVIETPTADFMIDTACQNAPINIQNNSLDVQSEIKNYYWWLDGELVSSENQPYIVLEDTLEHTLLLKVISQSLCSDTISKKFLTRPTPISSFTADKHYSTPNTPIHFEADYIDTTYHYSFNFGDDTLSESHTNTHAYTQEGDYTASLFVQNQWGCKHSSEQSISIVRPLMDLQIFEAQLIENDGKYQFEIMISNVGNLDIERINFNFQVNDRYTFEEVSHTELLIGETKSVILSSQLLKRPEYFCINISPEGSYADINLNNNILCVNVENKKDVFSIYPNPVVSEYSLLYYSEKDETVTIDIANMLGQSVSSFEINLKKGLHHYKINSEDLQRGQYLFKIGQRVITFLKE